VLRREAPPTNVDAVVASPSEVRRMTYRAGLLAAVLSLLGGEPAVNGALHAQAVDACTVLTLQELSSAAGVSVQRPRPDSAPEGDSICRFRAGTDTLTLAIGRSTRANFDELRQLLIEEKNSVVPVNGVGIAAYFWDNRIYVFAGTRSFSVQVGEAAPVSAKHQQMAQAVATLVAAKLK
jgi:hypothetical protein